MIFQINGIDVHSRGLSYIIYREHFTRFSPLQEINFMINADSGRLEDNNMILS
jgi:hypothetical protein